MNTHPACNSRNTYRSILRAAPLMFVLSILLLTACQKQKIKKHYTGNFLFTEIRTTNNYNSGQNIYTQVDTLVSNGTIEWVKKTTDVLISWPNEVGCIKSLQLEVDKKGNLTYTGGTTNAVDAEGKFLSDDEVYISWTFESHGIAAETVLRGTRI